MLACAALAQPAHAQQRPLVTEDPEPIGAGRVLIEGGIDYAHDQQYPVSGLRGNVWRIPTVGVSVGVGILSDPTSGNRQNDVLTYGLSFARAITQAAEVVGELNGRVSTRSGTAFPGTESRGLLRLGGRYTHGPVRFDAGVFVGLTTVDPTIGFTTGFTYALHAVTIP